MPSPLALVIEDEIDLSDIFSEAVRAAGFSPQVINHGGVAQERLKELIPEMIILDLHLPGVDGPHLLEQIRADERLKNTKVIVTTADHQLASTLNGKATLVLLKPISFSQLRDLATRLKALNLADD